MSRSEKAAEGSPHALFEKTFDNQTLVTLKRAGAEYAFSMPRTDIAQVGRKRAITVLDAADQLGIDLPYSCCGGLCATCLAQLTRGSVEHLENHMLSDDELKAGKVLVCQAVPTSTVIELRYPS